MLLIHFKFIAMQRQVHWIYVQLCNHGGVKELSYTPHTIMVEFAILALAVGKRTGLLVGVRYIYLRKNVELWWKVERCSSSTFPRYERRNLN